MHLYKHFWKMLRNNKKGIILYLVVGAIIVGTTGIISDNVVKEENEDGETQIVAESVDISYVDNDNSVLSKGIIEYLSKDNVLTDYSDKTSEKINNLVYFSITEFHIDIPEGLQEDVILGNETKNIEYRTNAAESSYSYTISSGINAYISMYKHYIDKGFSNEEAVKKAYDLLTKEQNIIVRKNDSGLGGSKKEWAVYEMSVYFTYVSLGMILLSAGSVLINANDEKVSKRIDSAPVSIFSRTLADILGLFSFGIIVWIVMTVVVLIYGQDTPLINNRGHLMVIGILLSVLCNCAMAAFIASFNLAQNTLSMVTNVFGLALSFMSGVFVPQWLLGEGVIAFSKFLPFYWSVRSFNMIYTESGAGLTFNINEIYTNFCMLCIYIVALSALSILVRKIRRA